MVQPLKLLQILIQKKQTVSLQIEQFPQSIPFEINHKYEKLTFHRLLTDSRAQKRQHSTSDAISPPVEKLDVAEERSYASYESVPIRRRP